MNKRERMKQQIQSHGRKLLAIFPDAQEQDPGKLCRKLHRMEAKAHHLTTGACNTQEGMDTLEAAEPILLEKVNGLLGTDRVWMNRDPRGCALKFDPTREEDIARDWGGYGLICPEFTGEV